jgi:hypothetical protein
MHKDMVRLIELAHRDHYYCEDSWYSCPKDPESSANDEVGEKCNCGADKINAEVDAIVKRLAVKRRKPLSKKLIKDINTVIFALEKVDHGWLTNFGAPAIRTMLEQVCKRRVR